MEGGTGCVSIPQIHFPHVGCHPWIANALHARKLEVVEIQPLHSISKNDGAKIISNKTETHVFEGELLYVASVNAPHRKRAGIDSRTFHRLSRLLGCSAAVEFNLSITDDDICNRRVGPAFNGQRRAIDAGC